MSLFPLKNSSFKELWQVVRHKLKLLNLCFNSKLLVKRHNNGGVMREHQQINFY